MGIRRDSLAAAAEAISIAEHQCGGGNHAHNIFKASQSTASDVLTAAAHHARDPSLVCTVGSISVWPGASNVIAGSSNFSVDIR